MVTTPEDAVQDAKEALRQEKYLANKQERREALAEACQADHLRALNKTGDDAGSWWSKTSGGGDGSMEVQVGTSYGDGEQHGKRRREGA